jgi:hypothetical protein
MTESDQNERDKEEARWLIKNGPTLGDKTLGVLSLIQAYHRIVRNPEDFPKYASHWLWANKDDYPPEILAPLIAKYGLPKSPRIEKGFTSWNSRGNRLYKRASNNTGPMHNLMR